MRIAAGQGSSLTKGRCYGIGKASLAGEQVVEGGVRPEVSLVVASYNGVREIEGTLGKVQAYFGSQPYAAEVVVVNDGSTDATAAALDVFSRRYPELKVLVNHRNMGKGYAIQKGMLEASGRFIFYTDADLAYPIEGIEPFLKPLQEGTHEIAVGSRVHANSLFHLHPRYFRYVYRRYLTSRLFNWTVRTLLGIGVRDTQCGFKGFTAEAARVIFSQVRISGFAFDVEVLSIAQRLGLRIIELPVTYAYSGEVSTVKFILSACQALVDLARICWWDRRGTYRCRC